MDFALLEQALNAWLPSYLAFAREGLKVSEPITVIAGVDSILGARLVTSGGLSEKCFEYCTTETVVVDSDDTVAIKQLVRGLRRRLHEAFGLDDPDSK